MKVYLAGPMRGHPNYIATFKACEKYLKEIFGSCEIFNPAEKEGEPGEETLEFRRKVFALDTAWICSHADIVAMIPGWENSAGARAEHALANAIGLEIIYLWEIIYL